MRRRLDQKSQHALQQLPEGIKTHWQNQRHQVEAAYQEDMKALDEHLANVGSALEKIKAALAKIRTMRQSIHTHPSHQKIAQAIQLELGIPAIVKKLTPSVSKEDTPLVRILAERVLSLRIQPSY